MLARVKKREEAFLRKIEERAGSRRREGKTLRNNLTIASFARRRELKGSEGRGGRKGKKKGDG